MGEQTTIVLTRREWRAIAAAWAVYEVQEDSDPDFRQDMAALARVKKKWYAALDAQED